LTDPAKHRTTLKDVQIENVPGVHVGVVKRKAKAASKIKAQYACPRQQDRF